MRKIITALLAAAAIAAPAAAAPRDPDAQLAKLLDGRVAGTPTRCITLRRATSSQIIEGRAIVYQDGRTLWINRPRGAESLRSDDVLLTKTIGDQLCNVDSVDLLDGTSPRFVRGFVILNDFVPYTLPPKVKSAN